MKSFIFTGLIAFALLFVVSCQKNDDSNVSASTDAINTTNDAAVSMYAEVQNDLESIDELADNQVENGFNSLEVRESPSCPSITSTAPKGTFPNTVTIDYGAGCTDAKGKYHSGKIIIEQTDSLRHAGAMRTTTFIDFGIDSVRMKKGTVILKNLSTDPTTGNRKLSREIKDMVFTGKNGSITINSSHTRTQLEGGNTINRSDDKWKIEGGSVGSNDNGIKFTTQITEPLIIKGDCPYIVNGWITIIKKDEETRIDYGNGTCDRFAIAHKKGKEFVIVLRPRF